MLKRSCLSTVSSIVREFESENPVNLEVGLKTKLVVMAMIMLMVTWTEAIGQKRRTTTRKKSTPAAPVVVDMRPEATKVSEQIGLFTKFLYVYGKVANGLEVAEDLAKRGESSPAIAARNRKSKEALIANISGLKAGLEALVGELKANSRLQVQYLKLSYASEATANAERLAMANRYDEAGQALVLAIQRMSETIISMRLM